MKKTWEQSVILAITREKEAEYERGVQDGIRHAINWCDSNCDASTTGCSVGLEKLLKL